jgi:hypothetical protein
MTKQYIGIITDNSMSMATRKENAAKDYNTQIDSIKLNSVSSGIDTIVSVVGCGYGNRAYGVGDVKRLIVNSSASSLQPIAPGAYVADGHSTPLFDSVGEIISLFKAVPDYDSPDVSFLVLVITDGEENSSSVWKNTLKAELQKLQETNRWTFTFRVPEGRRGRIAELGVFPDNICEWTLSNEGLAKSTIVAQTAVTNYYAARSAGAAGTQSFFTDANNIKLDDVKKSLTDITKECKFYDVDDGSKNISQFVTDKHGRFWLGMAFYQLTKKERRVQEKKLICVRDKKTQQVFSGTEARNLLGVPTTGSISLTPGNHGRYDIFIQSLSTNRALLLGSSVMIWDKARVI